MPPAYRNLWWVIPNVLAGMGMPYVDPQRRLNLGGSLEDYSDDLPSLYQAGIRAVVCLLNIPSDDQIFRKAGFNYQCLPIMDGFAPDVPQATGVIDFINRNRRENQPVAVSCEAGLGRTGTVIATYLIDQGMTAPEAISFVKSIEPAAIETPRQIKFLEEFANTKNTQKP
jgi:atypical dual specificity phosphatase